MNLQETINSKTKQGALYEKIEGGKVRCLACGHGCVISDNSTGICKVRRNNQGILMVPNGYVSGLGIDPIEKKPFFHVLPCAKTLSFGMLGCNFKCAFCQNHITSQALRDPFCFSGIEEISSDEIAALAVKKNIPLIVSTYNEPLITTEWAVEIFSKAGEKGIRGAYVSNGYATAKVLDFIRPYVDFYKVDLKTFNPDNYKRICGGSLEIVKKTIEEIYKRGFWLEIVTLLIPGFNDSEQELKDIAEFICGVSADIPWHVTAFHPDYKMKRADFTSPSSILNAVDTGKKAGLNYVYVGNMGHSQFENTFCPGCKELLVERNGYFVEKFSVLVDAGGKGICPGCKRRIAGVWK